MLTVEETIRKINAEKAQADRSLNIARSKNQEMEIILEFFAKSFAELITQISKGKYQIDVDFPAVQTVSGKVSVDGLTSLLHSMEELKSLTKKNKLELPNIQEISGEVTVKNPTPEVKIPEYPKQIKTDIVTLPKYVSEKLDDIKKALSGIELSPKIEVKNDAPQVTIDLDGVKNLLETLVEEIKQIQTTPEVNIDLKSVEKSVDEVKKAITELKFPVPNFQSSWSHSLSMRAEDLQADYGYTNDDPDNPDYIDVYDEDGSKWRRTFTYGTVGGVKTVTSKSKWSRA